MEKNSDARFWVEFITWSLFCIALGFALAGLAYNDALDKLILDLQIERTQLEIKILKGECKNDTTKTTTTGL